MATGATALANGPQAQARAPRHARADVHPGRRGGGSAGPRATRWLPQGGGHTHQGPSRAAQRQPPVAGGAGYSRRNPGRASQGQATCTGLGSHGRDDVGCH